MLGIIGKCSVPWGDIMMHVGDILSTMEDTQYHEGYQDASGGYHEYRGGVQCCGGNLLLFDYPNCTEHLPRYS